MDRGKPGVLQSTGHKESDMTAQLNWKQTEITVMVIFCTLSRAAVCEFTALNFLFRISSLSPFVLPVLPSPLVFLFSSHLPHTSSFSAPLLTPLAATSLVPSLRLITLTPCAGVDCRLLGGLCCPPSRLSVLAPSAHILFPFSHRLLFLLPSSLCPSLLRFPAHSVPRASASPIRPPLCLCLFCPLFSLVFQSALPWALYLSSVTAPGSFLQLVPSFFPFYLYLSFFVLSTSPLCFSSFS